MLTHLILMILVNLKFSKNYFFLFLLREISFLTLEALDFLDARRLCFLGRALDFFFTTLFLAVFFLTLFFAMIIGLGEKVPQMFIQFNFSIGRILMVIFFAL